MSLIMIEFPAGARDGMEGDRSGMFKKYQILIFLNTKEIEGRSFERLPSFFFSPFLLISHNR